MGLLLGRVVVGLGALGLPALEVGHVLALERAHVLGVERVAGTPLLSAPVVADCAEELAKRLGVRSGYRSAIFSVGLNQ